MLEYTIHSQENDRAFRIYIYIYSEKIKYKQKVINWSNAKTKLTQLVRFPFFYTLNIQKINISHEISYLEYVTSLGRYKNQHLS